MATVAFTPRRKHEFTGSCPQVSCNKDGWIVMVYNSGSKMYSIVGLIERNNISWGNTRPQPITTGHYPKVAINDENTVVEVHKSQWWKTAWYRVGTLDVHTKAIRWCSKDFPIGNPSGCNPAVALTNEGTVIIAYERSDETYYRVGKINETATEIIWKDQVDRQFFNIGSLEPSISMNENGLVVAVARTPYGCKIIFRVGYLENDNIIKWKEVDHEVSMGELMYGWGPTVAINEKNHIIAVYMSYVWRRLRIRYGVINNDTKKIEWRETTAEPFDYGFGQLPSITMNSKGQVVRMHESNLGYGMFYEVGALSE